MSQYRPGSLIGKGAQGKVYLAKHLLSNMDYAIKIVSKSAISKFHRNDDTGFQEVERLREATFRNCRNVVGLVQALEDTSNIYIVTRYISGGTLEAL